MSDFQAAKQVARDFHNALDRAKDAEIIDVFSQYCKPDLIWRGVHPFDQIQTPQDVVNQFWIPLKTSLTHLQRREDIFFAGTHMLQQNTDIWVVSMGHFVGLFDQNWLTIKPTGKMAFLRYCTFHKIVDGNITATTMHIDIPHLMTQAGQNPFPEQTAAHLVQPGPLTHDGILLDPQPATQGQATLQKINEMCDNLGEWQSGLPLEQELRLDWQEDMIWWGPAGIGATYTIERYAQQHAGPFRNGFTNREFKGHIARTAEGHFGGFFGWPNFVAQPTGGFMGMQTSDKMGEFRVIDIYRRQGEKLAENWIFIDLLHFYKSIGRPVF